MKRTTRVHEDVGAIAGTRHGGRAIVSAPCRLHPASVGTDDTPLDDLRFRALLGARAWATLPEAVRRRFGKRLCDARTATYVGHVTECRISGSGWWLAQLLRPLGGPLPTCADTGVPASVVVTEDEASAGQFWTRIYGRHDGFPTVIRSSKRFRGTTGLEEHIGFGIGMALTVSVAGAALRFDSAGYFVQLGPVQLPLPRWATPGALRVEHVDRGGGAFDFVMRLVHPWLGELVYQRARFTDGAPG